MLTTVNEIRKHFINELKDEAFTIDKTGQRTIEMFGASFVADEPAIFGTPNKEYIDAELKWYESKSTNVNDIPYPKGVPGAWQHAANKYGETNSNYGHLVFSSKWNSQFDNAFQELVQNPDSRRAIMVYNRPSIWVDYNEQDKNDFICTNAQTFYIRDNKLQMVSQMRSNDAIFGYKNDRAWADYLMDKFVTQWNEINGDDPIEKGQLLWQVQNLHVYERHFGLVG